MITLRALLEKNLNWLDLPLAIYSGDGLRLVGRVAIADPNPTAREIGITDEFPSVLVLAAPVEKENA